MTIHSFVGSKSTLKGDFACKEDFLVEGKIEGNLRSEGTIILGESAVVKGEVLARQVAVFGTIVGTIKCSERLEIFASARIEGIVHVPVIKIASGAKINGRIAMSSKLRDGKLISHSPEDLPASVVEAHR
jgi:cytoskeletal protein CcmA (bactofilin family)